MVKKVYIIYKYSTIFLPNCSICTKDHSYIDIVCQVYVQSISYDLLCNVAILALND